MMCAAGVRLDETLAAVLPALAAGEIRPVRFGCWAMRAIEAAGLAVEVSVSGPWLQVAAQLADGHVHDAVVPRVAWELGVTNGALPGTAKFVLRPGRKSVEAVWEVYIDSVAGADPIGQATLVRELIRRGIGDLAEALNRLRGAGVPATRQADVAVPVDFVELCAGANWTCHPRADGRVAAPLDVPGIFLQAMLETAPAPRAFVDLPVGRALPGPVRAAVGVLLLEVGGLVRWVRPTVRSQGEQTIISYEVPLGASVSGTALVHALGALSLACRVAYREAAALGGSEELANRYLAIRGLSAGSSERV